MESLIKSNCKLETVHNINIRIRYLLLREKKHNGAAMIAVGSTDGFLYNRLLTFRLSQ